MSITVKAIDLGYYGLKRRKVGDVFEIEHEKDFSKKWMKKVKDGVPVDESDVGVGKKATKKQSTADKKASKKQSTAYKKASKKQSAADKKAAKDEAAADKQAAKDEAAADKQAAKDEAAADRKHSR